MSHAYLRLTRFLQRRSAYLVLFLALLLTAGFTYYSYQVVITRAEMRFNEEVANSRSAIEDRIGTYVNALQQAKGFLVASASVGRSAFRTYVENTDILQEYPGIQGIGFAQRIPAEGLARHVAAVQASGYPDYRVWPEQPRDEYFSIVYLEPFDWRNQRAFGYDMFTEPVRREAMEMARDTGRPAMSGRVTLVQETESDRQPGFLIYVPVYRAGMPTGTVEERRAALVGFVYSPFRTHDLFDEALERQRQQGRLKHIGLEIHDSSQPGPGSLLYVKPATSAEPGWGGGFGNEERLDFAGRRWTVRAAADAGYVEMERLRGPVLVMTFGTLLSLMLFRIFRMEERRVVTAEQSRIRIASILESIGDAFASVDRRWRFTYVNRAAGEVLGRNPAELIGRNLWEEFPFARGTELERNYESAMREQRAVQFEAFVPAFDAWLDIRAYPSQDGLAIYFQDISEQKRSAEALIAERERLAVTLYSIADGVITTDTEGRIVLINKAAQELTGWSQQEASGKALASVFAPLNSRTREPMPDPAESVMRAGAVFQMGSHCILMQKDGSERSIALAGAPMRRGQKDLLGAVLVFRDVTQQIKTEQELVKVRNLEAIGVLAGGIAHDFNNILTSILGNISLAKLYLDASNQAFPILGEAERASLRARDLTQQLLTFAKGGMPIKRTASIAEVLRETAGFALRGSKVRGEFQIAEDLWPSEFDAGQMSQVINNLVINAEQAMRDGGTVTVSAGNASVNEGQVPGLAPGRYVRIEVRDRGIGIPEEHMTKIFDPYFTTKRHGAGLGLATAYSIVRRHGGHVRAESIPGEGTRFTIYLPAAADAPIDARSLEEPVLSGAGRVLIMDDEEAVRQVAARLLERLGYRPETARSGEEALSLYRQALEAGAPFAAVILDLTVPGGMGGAACLERLRDIDPAVRAIVSSGYSTDPVMADYRDFGFRGVIAKPFELGLLSQVMHAVIASGDGGGTAAD